MNLKKCKGFQKLKYHDEYSILSKQTQDLPKNHISTKLVLAVITGRVVQLQSQFEQVGPRSIPPKFRHMESAHPERINI